MDIRDKSKEELLKELQALQAITDQFKLMFNNAPLGYQSLDFDGNFKEVNQQWLDTLGYEREEVIGRWFGDFLTPAFKDGFSKRFPLFKAQGKIHSEFEMVHKNGSVLFIAFDGSIGYDSKGDFKQTHCIIQDITEKKQAEHDLRESEEEYRNLIDLSPVAMGIIHDWKTIYFNPAAVRLFGAKTQNELLGKHIFELIHPDFHELAIENADLLDEKGYVSMQEQKYIKLDGSILDVETQAKSIRFNDDTATLVIINDITERKKAEETLRESRDEFKLIISSQQDMMVKTDTRGYLLFVNPAYCAVFGKTEDELVGTNYAPMVHPDDHPTVEKAVAQLFVPPYTCSYEERAWTVDGLRWLSWTAKAVLDDNGNVIALVGSGRDITAGKLAEDALRESEAQLKEAQRIAKIGSWDLDIVNNILKWSDEIYSMFEIDPNIFSATYEAFLEAIHPDDRESVNFAYTNSLSTRSPYSIEHRLRLSNGKIKYVQEKCESFFDADGKPLRSIGTVQDITGRKLTEQALVQSHELMRYVIEHNQSAIAIHDKDLKYIYVSQRYLHDYNIKEKDIIGKHHYDVFPDLPQKWRDVHQKALSGVISSADNDSYMREDGTLEWTRWECRPWYEADGSIGGIIIYTEVITGRKQAEEALRKSEENHSITLQSIGDGVISTDLNGLIVNMNPVAEKLCDWKLTDALGKPLPEVFKIINAETRKTDTDPVKKVLENGEIVGLANHTVLISKNGNEYQIADSAAPIKTKEGAITGVVLVFSDVTEKYAAQRQIKESEERFQLAMNASNDGLFDWNLETNDIYYAPSWKKMLGYEDHELPNDFSVWENTTEPEDVKKSWELQQKLIARQIDQFVLEFKMKHKHGHWVDILSRAKAIFDDNGKAIRIVGTHADITERKQTEEKIREKEVQYRNLANFGLALIWTAGTDKLCNYFNEPWLKFTGRKLEQELGNGWAEGVHPDDFDRCLETYVTAFDKKESFEMEYRLMHFSGEYRWILDLGNPNYNSSGEFIGYIGHCFDITERKRIEQELVKAIDQAQESDRLKSAFLANMSHEIRTPMNGILGFAGLLKEPGLTGEQQQEYIRIIEKSGVRMLNIINDIVDISKIEAGLMKLDMKETNINEQIEYIYTFFKPEVEAKGMKLSFNTPLPAKEAVITTDREKVYAILTNLVKNAIKFTNNGSIEFGYKIANTLPVEETLHATSQQVSSQQVSSQQVMSLQMQFYVKDTGVGIPIDRQEAIFERFVQADIADKMAHQGAGLGLSITKAYIEMLGGKIWVESEVGIGSIFYFTLPYHADPMKKNVAHQLTTSDKTDQIRKLKILITEDDDVSEMLIDLTVKSFGKEVLKARTGFEAVEVCKKNPDMDLVLMDIQLPEMNGYDATRQIREFNKEVIIIAQTAYGQSGDREMAIKSGCNDYIAKPISKDELFELIHTYFGK